eukprot:jgi/Tetstr1/433416/TSEL_022690.t1
MANRQFRFVHALTCSNASAFFYSEREAADQLRRSGHLCELMLGDELCRGYADIDVDVGDDPRPFEELHDVYLPLVRAVCEVVQRYVKEALPQVKDAEYVLATRHGTKPDGSRKLSFRPFFKGWVSSRPVLGRFFEFINRCGEARLPFDVQPYGASSQKLAAILCSKSPADGRVLRPERDGDSPLDYLAQHWEESWPALAITGASEPPLNAAPAGVGGKGDPDLVALVVAGIKKGEDYDRWTRVGWAIAFELGKTAKAREIFREWSSRAANYNALACDRVIDGVRAEGRRCTLGTLKKFLAEDDPEMHRELTTGAGGAAVVAAVSD